MTLTLLLVGNPATHNIVTLEPTYEALAEHLGVPKDLITCYPRLSEGADVHIGNLLIGTVSKVPRHEWTPVPKDRAFRPEPGMLIRHTDEGGNLHEALVGDHTPIDTLPLDITSYKVIWSRP